MKIGLLSSGGDCQGLNAALRAVTLAALRADPAIQVLGIERGYEGLMTGRARPLNLGDVAEILPRGGTILGTSRQPYKKIVASTRPGYDGEDLAKLMCTQYQKLALDALVILGGNGTHKTARLLSEYGLNIVTLPKTIDNDLWGTDMTFGFQSAVDAAALFLDAIHTTAASHGRIFLVRLMGHKVGWLSLYAGIAGGADVILIPEIKVDPARVLAAAEQAVARRGYCLIAMAEGARMQPGSEGKEPYESLLEALKQNFGESVRTSEPGHFQRGGVTSAYDRVLASVLGSAAMKHVLDRRFGCMMAVRGRQIVPLSLEEVADKLKEVDPDDPAVKTARSLGISFGN